MTAGDEREGYMKEKKNRREHRRNIGLKELRKGGVKDEREDLEKRRKESSKKKEMKARKMIQEMKQMKKI